MYRTMEALDEKIEQFKIKRGEGPDYITVGRRSYYNLCNEAAHLNKYAGKTVLISKYSGCDVIVIGAVDIMIELGVTGDKAINLLSGSSRQEANA